MKTKISSLTCYLSELVPSVLSLCKRAETIARGHACQRLKRGDKLSERSEWAKEFRLCGGGGNPNNRRIIKIDVIVFGATKPQKN